MHLPAPRDAASSLNFIFRLPDLPSRLPSLALKKIILRSSAPFFPFVFQAFTTSHFQSCALRCLFVMFENTMSDGILSQELAPSTGIEQPPESSRLIKNDQRWDSLKDEIYQSYIADDNTLPVTMRTFEHTHGFAARFVCCLHPLSSTSH